MAPETFSIALEAADSVQPFHPFLVEMKNGELYEADYPKAISLIGSVASFVRPGGLLVVFDAESVVQVIYASRGEFRNSNPYR